MERKERWIGRKGSRVLVLPVKGGPRIYILPLLLVGGIERQSDRQNDGEREIGKGEKGVTYPSIRITSRIIN